MRKFILLQLTKYQVQTEDITGLKSAPTQDPNKSEDTIIKSTPKDKAASKNFTNVLCNKNENWAQHFLIPFNEKIIDINPVIIRTDFICAVILMC